ncbi:13812_t:CDS:2, partial [Dentiscutata erythropus]
MEYAVLPLRLKQLKLSKEKTVEFITNVIDSDKKIPQLIDSSNFKTLTYLERIDSSFKTSTYLESLDSSNNNGRQSTHPENIPIQTENGNSLTCPRTLVFSIDNGRQRRPIENMRTLTEDANTSGKKRQINNFITYIQNPLVFQRIFQFNINLQIQNLQRTKTRKYITGYALFKKRIVEEGLLINVTNVMVIGPSTNIIWRSLTRAEKEIFLNYALQIRSNATIRNKFKRSSLA